MIVGIGARNRPPSDITNLHDNLPALAYSTDSSWILARPPTSALPST